MSVAVFPKKETELSRKWLGRIKSVETKWFEEWVKEAKEIERIFRNADRSSSIHYNMLFSMVQTLRPALYNSLPLPDIRRRYSDDDPVALEATEVLRRGISYYSDSADFDQAMRDSVGSCVLYGMGVHRWRYYPEDEDGPDRLEVEHVPYGRFIFGSGAAWEEVQWVAFKHYLTRAELEERFEADWIKDLIEDADDLYGEFEHESKAGGSDSTYDPQQPAATVPVWEVWDKRTKKVHFLSELAAYPPLDTLPWPIPIFPCSAPLYLDDTPGNLAPVPFYRVVKDLIDDLDLTTRRIRKLIWVCRYRGIYDPLLREFPALFDAQDAEFIPCGEDGVALERGMSNALWEMPIEAIVKTVGELLMHREALKAAVYDVSGLADILRGVSDPRETASAQQLKSQNAAGRLSQYQRQVSRYARDSLRLAGELLCTTFSPESLKQLTLSKVPTQQEAMLQQQQAQMQAMQAQATGQQPPPPPPQPPFVWEQVAQLLKDKRRNFQIDIESNSTVAETYDVDLTNVQNLLTGISEFVAAVFPAVQAGMVPPDLVKQLMLVAVRRARGGKPVEDALQLIAQPAPPPEQGGQGPAGSNEVDGQIAQMEQQAKAQELDVKGKEAAGKLAIEMAKIEQKDRAEQLKAQLKERELALKEAQMQYDQMQAQVELQMSREQQYADMAMSQQQMEMDQENAQTEIALGLHDRQREDVKDERDFEASRQDTDREFQQRKRESAMRGPRK